MNPPSPVRRSDYALTTLLTAVAVACAAWMFAAHFHHPEQLWRDVEQDRGAHYLYGLNLAIALRALNPVVFLIHLEGIRTWVPLHPLLVAVTLGIGGIDHRLAIIPSLVGWVLTVVLTGLIARRLFPDRIDGTTAGIVAATFAIASPHFRHLGGDVMLEALGAGLTALAIWLYLRAREAPDDYPRWRLLAVVLTLLFLEKQNYWLLTAFSLAIAFISEAPRQHFARARELIAGIEMRTVIAGALRDPLLIACAAVCAIVLVLVVKGPTSIEVLGRRVSLYPPGILLTVAWALLFIRLAIAWHRHRAVFDRWSGTIGRALFYWHAVPLGIFLLLPKRLEFLMVFVSPANKFPTQHFNPWSGMQFYGRAFVHAYQVAPWSAALAAGLALVGVSQLGRLTPAARAPMIVLVVSLVAVVLHPNTLDRYLASWIFTVWIFAGAGAAIVLSWLTSRLPAMPRAAVTAAIVALLAAAHLRASPPASAAHDSVAVARPSDLDLAAVYLPKIEGIRTVGFVLSFGYNLLPVWTVRDQCRCPAVVDLPTPPAYPSRQQASDTVEEWIGRTPAQRIVVIDTFGRNDYPELGWNREAALGLLDGMARQRRFERIETIQVPSYPAEISIWSPRAVAAEK